MPDAPRRPDESDAEPTSGAWSWSDLGGSHPPPRAEASPTASATRRYEPGPELGRGGMGVVFAVVDTALGRTVARKELLDGADAARLRREARVTASLEHPGIVPVYDAGEDACGRPWYTMRVASRHTLADAIAEAGSAPRRRVALVRRVLAAAEAVAYAHTRGVVHRDLKPANILVGEHGETQVADWGLAVSVGDGATGSTSLPVGTPAWMSPEQATGAPADPRFDVYALGAILLAVATGRPPFHDLPSSEVLAALRRGEALAPRPEDGPPELVAIARQALAADPSQRYADAGAFAEELARWLDGERVRAHTYTFAEMFARQVRRYRTPLVVLACAVVALLGTGGYGWWRTEHARARAVEAEAATAAALATSDAHLSRALVSQGRAALHTGAIAEAALLGARALALGRDDAEAKGILAGALAAGIPRRLAVGHIPACVAHALSEDGGRIACLEAGAVSLWRTQPLTREWRVDRAADRVELRGGRVLARDRTTLYVVDASGASVATIPGVSGAWGFAVSPDGARAWLATADATPLRVDVDAGSVTPARACVSGAFGHAWDGSREATICADGSLVADDRVVTTAFGGALGRPERVLLVPGASIVVGGTFQGTVAFVDTRTGATLRVLTPDGSPIRDLSSSPSGRLLAVATERGGVSVWRVDTGARVLQLPRERVDRVQFVDEERLAVSGRTWALWVVPTDARPWRLVRPHGVGALAASGAWVAGAYGDGAAVAWRVDDGRSTEVRWQGEVAKDVTFDAVGFTGSAMGTSEPARFALDGRSLGEWAAGRAQRFRRVERLGASLLGVSFDPEGPFVWADPAAAPRALGLGDCWEASGDASGAQVVVAGARGVHLVTAAGAVTQIDDRAVRAADVEGAVVALATDDGVSAGPVGAYRAMAPVPDVALDLALSLDGALLAAGGRSGVAWVWEVRTGTLLATLRGHRDRVAGVEFGPDGALWTGGWDGALVRWDLDAARRDPRSIEVEAEAAGVSLEAVLGLDYR